MGKFIKYQLPACLWAILIFILSSIPRLSPPMIRVGFVDKIYHFLEYFIFGFLLARLFLSMSTQGRERQAILATVALGVFWGGTDEIHQAFVMGREASWMDFLADVVGVLCGSTLVWWRLRRRMQAQAQGHSRRGK
jgi:VanZ family protein